MRTIIITGANSGIGGAVADWFLELGDRVIGIDMKSSARKHPYFLDFTLDIADWDQLDGFMESLEQVVPNGIDGLVHCAAIGQISSLKETTRDTWERVIRVNLSATIALLQGIDGHLNDHARIVLFGSGTGIRGAAEMFAYSATKGGIMALAKSLAHEFGDRNITVNVVSPGFTRTAMTDSALGLENKFMAPRAIRRPELPEDLIGITEFLLSDSAAFITGQTISVDGGSVKL